MLTMKNGKRELTKKKKKKKEKKRSRTLGGKENCKYLGILEADTIKPAEMKEK